MSYITEAEKNELLKDVFNYSDAIDFNEIVKMMHESNAFAVKVIELYLKERKKTQPLNEDELYSYCWDMLLSCDEDKDEKAIEETFSYYRTLNKRNPLRLRLLYNEWNGIRD